MIPLMGLLLCVYLVFKGVEILQIGLSSSRPDNHGVKVIGIFALLASVAIAAFFALIFLTSGAANNIPSVTGLK